MPLSPLHQRLNRPFGVLGSPLVDAFHFLALFAIDGSARFPSPGAQEAR